MQIRSRDSISLTLWRPELNWQAQSRQVSRPTSSGTLQVLHSQPCGKLALDSPQYLVMCVGSRSKDENIVILARSTKNYAVPSPNKKGGREAKIGFQAGGRRSY